MPRMQPLPPETTPELRAHFDFFPGTLGFTPNSVLTMQRKPKLVMAFAQLNGAVMDPAGEVDLGFRRLIGHVVSKVSGCLYCLAHTLLGAHNFGVSDAKLADVWTYASSPHYSERERLALDFALVASSQPNAVTDEQFLKLRAHWSEGEIVEILGVVAAFAFLNRWNDTMATPLEMRPIEVAQRALGGQGWDAGKHGLGEWLDANQIGSRESDWSMPPIVPAFIAEDRRTSVGTREAGPRCWGHCLETNLS